MTPSQAARKPAVVQSRPARVVLQQERLYERRSGGPANVRSRTRLSRRSGGQPSTVKGDGQNWSAGRRPIAGIPINSVTPWPPRSGLASGSEAAQVVLGHAKADVTQVYAEREPGQGRRGHEAHGLEGHRQAATEKGIAKGVGSDEPIPTPWRTKPSELSKCVKCMMRWDGGVDDSRADGSRFGRGRGTSFHPFFPLVLITYSLPLIPVVVIAGRVVLICSASPSKPPRDRPVIRIVRKRTS